MSDNGVQGLPQVTDSSTDQVDNENSLASDFLKGIPDVDKNVVEKYVKDWDAKVTQKFQELNGQVKTYKELGELEYLKQAKEVARMLETNPKYVYDLLAEELKLNQPPGGAGTPAPTAPTGQPPIGEQQTLQGLPPEILKKLEDQENLLKQLSQTVLSRHQQEQQAREEQELDNYLKGLKEKVGDFDEEFVLLRMYKGMDGEAAAKEYMEKFGNPGSSRIPAPPPLIGGGIVPSQSQSVAEMSREDTQKLVAGLLGQVQKG